jgi:hypothetical protein
MHHTWIDSRAGLGVMKATRLKKRKKKKNRSRSLPVRVSPASLLAEILAFHPLSKTGFAFLPSLELVSLLCHYEASATCSIAIWGVLICKKKEYTSFHFYHAVFSYACD